MFWRIGCEATFRLTTMGGVPGGGEGLHALVHGHSGRLCAVLENPPSAVELLKMGTMWKNGRNGSVVI